MSDQPLMTVESSKAGLIATLTELLELTPGQTVLSRIRTEGTPPPMVMGTQSNERPDVFASGKARPVLLETVTMKDFGDPEKLYKRLYLFYSASEMYGWDYQLACYRSNLSALKGFCAKREIRYSKIWDL